MCISQGIYLPNCVRDVRIYIEETYAAVAKYLVQRISGRFFAETNFTSRRWNRNLCLPQGRSLPNCFLEVGGIAEESFQKRQNISEKEI